MAYTIHATGKSVTVKAAEKFQRETGFKIAAGLRGGGWFCFKMKKAADIATDTALLNKYFKGALIESSTVRSKRVHAIHAALPKVTALLSESIHQQIAREIIAQMPTATVDKQCAAVGAANHSYCNANNLMHNAHDYYAVQDVLMTFAKAAK
jgi:hypothetical protein